MYLMIDAHRCCLPHYLCPWFGYDRSEDGDHIFDFKAYRIRVNFRWKSED
jgi:hypothetical protein